ncbi:MAG: squalene/phytoene synthase family protein [Anaerolineales bacterium]|nr:squalene/phytoene synthase family protein [Anaerolineales bacterium]
MSDVTAALAELITQTGSKQTYYTARLMVDKDLISDFYRAYAYFRWADDVIDVESHSNEERISFTSRQRELIDSLYNDESPDDLFPEEEILADLIKHDKGENSGLQSFIRNMFAIIEFDAFRKWRLVTQEELIWYTDCLGISVTEGLLYFIGNGHPYPDNGSRYLAAEAAHITHLLRDMSQDTSDGFINIPREYLDAHGINPEDMESIPYRNWVQERVELARRYFHEGKRYLDELEVLRCKIVGYWYCARFEAVLDIIERDDYVLRVSYDERRKPSTWIKIAWLGVTVALRHIAKQLEFGR